MRSRQLAAIGRGHGMLKRKAGDESYARNGPNASARNGSLKSIANQRHDFAVGIERVVAEHRAGGKAFWLAEFRQQDSTVSFCVAMPMLRFLFSDKPSHRGPVAGELVGDGGSGGIGVTPSISSHVNLRVWIKPSPAR